MTKTKRDILQGVDLNKLIEFVREDGGDGHSIWKSSMFTDMGFAAKDLPIRKHTSDGSYKGTVFGHDGKPIEPTGVYGLDFMYQLARFLGVTFPSFMGRGFQARAIQSAVLAELTKRVEPGVDTPEKVSTLGDAAIA